MNRNQKQKQDLQKIQQSHIDLFSDEDPKYYQPRTKLLKDIFPWLQYNEKLSQQKKQFIFDQQVVAIKSPLVLNIAINLWKSLYDKFDADSYLPDVEEWNQKLQEAIQGRKFKSTEFKALAKYTQLGMTEIFQMQPVSIGEVAYLIWIWRFSGNMNAENILFPSEWTQQQQQSVMIPQSIIQPQQIEQEYQEINADVDQLQKLQEQIKQQQKNKKQLQAEIEPAQENIQFPIIKKIKGLDQQQQVIFANQQQQEQYEEQFLINDYEQQIQNSLLQEDPFLNLGQQIQQEEEEGDVFDNWITSLQNKQLENQWRHQDPQQLPVFQEVNMNQQQFNTGINEWENILGEHRFSMQRGVYLNDQQQIQFITPDVIPQYLEREFIPGHDAQTQVFGPRLQYKIDPQERQQIGPDVPYMEPIFQPSDVEWTKQQRRADISGLLQSQQMRLIRLTFAPPAGPSQGDDIGNIQFLLEQSRRVIQENGNYVPMRIFIHIATESQRMINEVIQPGAQNHIQMNWQDVVQITENLSDESEQGDAKNFRDVLQKLLNDAHNDEYYDKIADPFIRFINIFILLTNVESSIKSRIQDSIRSQQIHAKNVSGVYTWLKLDRGRMVEEWQQFSCLERIMLYCHNKEFKRSRKEFIGINHLDNEYIDIMKAARKGQFEIVFEHLTKEMRFDISVYANGHNSWVYGNIPDQNEDKRVIVIDKGHACIVENQELQKELKKDQKYYRMRKPRPMPSYIRKYSFDIETYTTNEKGEQIPYLICVIEENNIEHSFWGSECISQFLGSFIKQQKIKWSRDRLEFWSFNGSKFDMMLLIKTMMKITNDVHIVGSNTCFKMIQYLGVQFLDMRLIYQGSLESVARDLGCLNNKKKDCNVAGFSKQQYEHNKDLIIEYCIHDTKILKEIVDKHYEYKKLNGIDHYHVATCSSLAITLYQQKFLNDKQAPILGPKSMEEYLLNKSAYYGGFTQGSFIGNMEQQVESYDANSLYPSCMLGDMPSQFQGIKEYQRGELIQEINCYEIEGEWKNTIYYPVFCEPTSSHKETKTHLYLKKFSRQWRWGISIKFALENGCFEQIRIFRVIQYLPSRPFTQFITEMSKLRTKYREENKKELAQTTKIVMNSFYGKFGQKHFPEVVWVRRQNLSWFLDREDLNGISEVAPDIFRLQFMQPIGDLNWIGACVKYAGFTTAGGLNKLFQKALACGMDRIIYMDTDSIYAIVKENMQIIQKEDIDEIKLGYWKLEHQIQNSTWNGPKFYKILAENNQLIQHIKGVSKQNYSENLWKQLEFERSATIENKDIFHKKFGRVFVYSDKKVIRVKDPPRYFFPNQAQNYKWSRPFKDLNEFKKVQQKYNEDQLQIELQCNE